MTASMLVAPVTMPLSLAETKEYLKIDHGNEDTLLTDLIKQATQFIETRSGCKLIHQTWRVYLDDVVQHQLVKLPLSPLVSFVEGRYYDGQGLPQTIDPNSMEIDFVSRPTGVIFREAVLAAPSLNGIELDFVAGYGATSESIPGDLKQALLVTVAHWYEFRGAIRADEHPVSTPEALEPLLRPYHVHRI